MKTQVILFYKKNKKTGQIETESIKDMYTEVGVEFTGNEISLDQLRETIRTYSTSFQKEMIGRFVVDGVAYFSGEAKDIPSIGDIVCGYKTIMADIPDSVFEEV